VATMKMSEAIASIPDHIKPMIASGFRIASIMPLEKSEKLLKLAIQDYIDRTDTLSKDGREIEFDLPRAEYWRAASALIPLVGILLEGEGQAHEFVDAAKSANLVDEESRARILSLAEAVVADRGRSSQIERQVRLGAAVLPSFDKIEYVTDIRVRITDGKIESIPVAILYLQTDAEDERLWFQLTKRQLQVLLDMLKQAESDMSVVEAAAAKIT
jgi:hypothetical protein